MIVSIIIPVKNGAATLQKCLQQILVQVVNAEKEIIIIDSGSTDNSIAIANQYGAKVISIKPSEFNHGSTRNLGVQNATGELIYFTVQDAFFAKENDLQTMIDHFKNENIVGVFGMQAVEPIPANNPAFWFKRASQPVVQHFSFPVGVYENMKPQEQFPFTAWENVNAMYRKTSLETTPFRAINYAEDRLWAHDVLCQNKELIIDANLVVYHYHHLTFSYWYKILLVYWSSNFLYFEVKPSMPSFVTLCKRIFHLLKHKDLSIGKKIYWIGHNKLQYFGECLSVLRFRWLLLTGGKVAIQREFEKLTKQVPQGQIKL